MFTPRQSLILATVPRRRCAPAARRFGYAGRLARADQQTPSSSRWAIGSRRRGAAVVELAICLPTLLILVFGSIELTNMIFLKQAITAAAYEGARTAIRTDTNDAQVWTRVNELLAVRNVRQAQIQVAPSLVDQLPRGTPITVRVSAPISANRLGLTSFITDRMISGAVTMVKE